MKVAVSGYTEEHVETARILLDNNAVITIKNNDGYDAFNIHSHFSPYIFDSYFDMIKKMIIEKFDKSVKKEIQLFFKNYSPGIFPQVLSKIIVDYSISTNTTPKKLSKK